MALSSMRSLRRGSSSSSSSTCSGRAACCPQQRLQQPHRLPLRALRAVKLEKEVEAKVEEDEFDGPDVTVSTQEVATLLNTLVADTEIAEMELKMGSFKLRVRRNLDAADAPAPAPAGGAAAAAAAALAAYAPPPMAPAYASADDAAAAAEAEAVDEALVYVIAPKVGVFRRGKYAGGKKVGKGTVASVGDQVKKGQTLGYVEQLGTFVEIKAPQAGEIAAYRAEEGDAVEYGQRVVELAPFFGGHIIGDSKYA